MKKTKNKTAATNIGLAIVRLTIVNSTFVILLSICANVGLTFFQMPHHRQAVNRCAKFNIFRNRTYDQI